MFSDFIHSDSLIDHLTGSETKKKKMYKKNVQKNEECRLIVLVTENLYNQELKT